MTGTKWWLISSTVDRGNHFIFTVWPFPYNFHIAIQLIIESQNFATFPLGNSSSFLTWLLSLLLYMILFLNQYYSFLHTLTSFNCFSVDWKDFLERFLSPDFILILHRFQSKQSKLCFVICSNVYDVVAHFKVYVFMKREKFNYLENQMHFH